MEDEILKKYGSSWLTAVSKKMVNSVTPGFQKIAGALFQRAQTRAERHHEAIRAGLLKMDTNLQNLLAFSGKSE